MLNGNVILVFILLKNFHCQVDHYWTMNGRSRSVFIAIVMT